MVRGRTEFGKMFGINCRRFLFSPPPLHFSPFLPTPGVLLSSPAFSLACSISAWKRKRNGCYVGYTHRFSVTLRLRRRNTRYKNPQLVAQHCYVASFSRCFPFFTLHDQLEPQRKHLLRVEEMRRADWLIC